MSSAQYITMLEHVRGSGGDTRLIAGTRSRIYCNTGADGNWRMLLDAEGSAYVPGGVPEERWKMAQLGNIVVFTNGIDRPYWWSFEKGPNDTDGDSCELIDDLVAMDVTIARVVAQWKGFVFFADVVMEGESYRNRVIWSDFNDPLSFTPLPDSLAAYADLGADERILAMAPLGGQFRVYTDKAIYSVDLVDSESVFNFREIYRGPQTLRFENSLVNLGSTHIYGGEDSLYVLGETDRTPMLVDWLYKASGAIYEGLPTEYLNGIPTATLDSFGKINRQKCFLLVGGYSESEKMIWYSWAADDEIVPAHSLILQTDIMKGAIVDDGFTAFCSHLPSYQPSVRRWLADVGACQPYPMAKEGNPIPVTFTQDTSLVCVRNHTDTYDDDWEKDVTTGNSLCDKINDTPTLEPDCTACGNGFKFIMASAQDKCLKEYSPDIYYREYCTTLEASRTGLTWTSTDHPTTTATYESLGYVTLLQSDAMDMGTPNNKTVHRVSVEYDAPDVVDASAAQLHSMIGYGSQPRSLIWQTSRYRPLDRLSSLSEADMLSRNIRPNRIATFPFMRTGSQIGYRFMIADANMGPVIGGAASLNEASIQMRVSHNDVF